jgi:hypothetical protein
MIIFGTANPGNIMLRPLLFFVCGLLLVNNSSAQMSVTSIFLQGAFVEVAINECGVYGSDEEPPIGPFGEYHDVNWNGLGYVADHEQDGWDVSTEPGQPIFCGDYFTPGSPEEGWAIQIGDSVFENHNLRCYGYTLTLIDTLPDMFGANVSYTDSAGIKSGVWEGTLTWDSILLTIRQTTYLPDSALFFISKVEIINESPVNLTDVYYMRNVDPDQDVDWCGEYSTTNAIISNTPSSDTSYVTSIGDECGCFMGTISTDPRARVSYGSFFLYPNKPSDAYNGLMPYLLEGDSTFDGSEQITFKFDLAAGEATAVAHARFFQPSEIDVAVNMLEDILEPSVLIDGEVMIEDTPKSICKGESLELHIDGFDAFDWVWEPEDYLDISIGATVTTTPEEDITYTATVSGGGLTYLVEVPIIVSQPMEISLSSTPAMEGTSTGSVSVVVTEGGIPPFSYEWTSGDTTATSSGLASGGYVVWVTDAVGCETTATVSVGVATQISSLDAEQVFQVYPNPASNSVTIDLTAIAGLQNHIQITSINGAMMWETTNANAQLISIDIADWPAGVYLLQVNNEAGSFIQRLSVD